MNKISIGVFLLFFRKIFGQGPYENILKLTYNGFKRSPALKKVIPFENKVICSLYVIGYIITQNLQSCLNTTKKLSLYTFKAAEQVLLPVFGYPAQIISIFIFNLNLRTDLKTFEVPANI